MKLVALEQILKKYGNPGFFARTFGLNNRYADQDHDNIKKLQKIYDQLAATNNESNRDLSQDELFLVAKFIFSINDSDDHGLNTDRIEELQNLFNNQYVLLELAIHDASKENKELLFTRENFDRITNLPYINSDEFENLKMNGIFNQQEVDKLLSKCEANESERALKKTKLEAMQKQNKIFWQREHKKMREYLNKNQEQDSELKSIYSSTPKQSKPG